ncbi:GlyGly-CTERM sorting domain-containing protein [Vibrio anguillarum]|uniref:GlyGly-CTERM sorting domain-containing protein n=2 Tax=Vibrio anguillarum TaxID=55601 RepID=A0A7U6FS56_VIBAN|nr:GlyGly-CTERM sorting domain-containing protein [Vibrio anguillarum]AZS26320.1 GlyGly-CTERM sorting domain-containing protein [Vibrio anguillarum]MBF4374465.1 GlyGly-CTERM sorting domain-containing protein [Vibrio anguillarum]
MKHSLLATALIGSLTATSALAANVIEVSAFFHESANLNQSQEVVGFYRSLEISNKLFSDKGVDIVLKPTHIGLLTNTETTASQDVFNGQIQMRTVSDNLEVATNIGDVALGIFEPLANTIGQGGGYDDSDYVNNPNSTRKVAISKGYLAGLSGAESAALVFPHEMLHSFGATHTESEAAGFNSLGGSRVDGYSATCSNGLPSLMRSSPLDSKVSDMSISGALDCIDVKANMVGFANQYAPSIAAIAASRNNQTLNVGATENINTQQFDITVTRNQTGSAETIMLYVAGGLMDTGSGLEPIAVNFGIGESSRSVAIPFTNIHPLFVKANNTIQSTYAVAIGANEVSNAALNLLSVNTQWVAPTIDTVTPPASDSGSGGSISWVLSLIVLGVGIIRRKMFKL